VHFARIARRYASCDDPAINTRTPPPILLSQALAGFIIEFDNEAEHQMPHRTTDYGSTSVPLRGPWLLSMVLWMKFIRFILDEGISVGELQRLARLDNKGVRAWLTRLSKWWGYLTVEAVEPGASRSVGAGIVVSK
jgi:hypothetical protein